MKNLIINLLVLLLFSNSILLGSDDEISLFNAQGKATAYIAEELTIYLWSGKPVAYLDKDQAGGFHIYGFNGKHLGWYVKGAIRDHKGKVAGGESYIFSNGTNLEPFKGFKGFKSFKSFKSFAPHRPYFIKEWSDMSLNFFLKQGES